MSTTSGLALTLDCPGCGEPGVARATKRSGPAPLWEWTPSGAASHTLHKPGTISLVASALRPCCPPGWAKHPRDQSGQCHDPQVDLCRGRGSIMKTTSKGRLAIASRTFRRCNHVRTAETPEIWDWCAHHHTMSMLCA